MESSTIISLQQEANNLNLVATMFIKYFCFLIIPPSVLGHFMSFYIFTRPSLRTNPCVMYFLSATFFSFLNASYNLPMRLIQTNYGYADPTISSSAACKTIWFLVYPLRSLAFWFITLACVNRYLSSSRSLTVRSWSDIRVTVRVIPLTILLNFLVYILVPIGFKLDIVPGTGNVVCYTTGPPGPYRTALNYINLFFFGLLPPLCMLIFGMLTVQHIQQTKRIRAVPLTDLQSTNISNARKKDRQILRMLFIQVLVYSITGLGFSITLIITTASSNQSKNVYQVAQANLANAIVGVVSTLGPCLNFYLFTLSSTLFQGELKKLFKKSIKFFNHHQEN